MVEPKFKVGDEVILLRGGSYATKHTVIKVKRSNHRRWFCLITNRVFPVSQNDLMLVEEAVVKRLLGADFRVVDSEEELRRERDGVTNSGWLRRWVDVLHQLSKLG